MAINLTDELNASTKKGKIASAKQVYLEGDSVNLQDAHAETDKHLGTLDSRSTQLENSIKDISASGGASTANAVSYNNDGSGLTAINAQAAIDELASKKADSATTTEELAKKFDKSDVVQELGDAIDKVMSQKAINDNFPVYSSGCIFGGSANASTVPPRKVGDRIDSYPYWYYVVGSADLKNFPIANDVENHHTVGKYKFAILRELSENRISKGYTKVLEIPYISHIDSLIRAGWLFGGTITPSSSPRKAEEELIVAFYIPTQAGTYTNFGGLSVAEGELCVIRNNSVGGVGTENWTKMSLDNFASKKDLDNFPVYSSGCIFGGSANASTVPPRKVGDRIDSYPYWYYVVGSADLKNFPIANDVENHHTVGKYKFAILRELSENRISKGYTKVLEIPYISHIDSLIRAGWLFGGTITPSSSPRKAEEELIVAFYIPTQAGTYTNFGGLSVAEGELCVIRNNSVGGVGTENWTKMSLDNFASKKDLDNFPVYSSGCIFGGSANASTVPPRKVGDRIDSYPYWYYVVGSADLKNFPIANDVENHHTVGKYKFAILRELSENRISKGYTKVLEIPYISHIDSLIRAGWLFGGTITPSSSPRKAEEELIVAFYIPTQAGTYTNFGGLSVAEGELCVIRNNSVGGVGTENWTKMSLDNFASKKDLDNFPVYSSGCIFGGSANASTVPPRKVGDRIDSYPYWYYVVGSADLKNFPIANDVENHHTVGKYKFAILRELSENRISKGYTKVLEIPYISHIDSLIRAGWLFGGTITPSSSPRKAEEELIVAFYIPTQAGTYTNFGGLSVAEGELCVIRNNSVGGVGTENWTKMSLDNFASKKDLDNFPTKEEVIELLNALDVDDAVSKWLDAHPEATTSVADGSITVNKLDKTLADTLKRIRVDSNSTTGTWQVTDNDLSVVVGANANKNGIGSKNNIYGCDNLQASRSAYSECAYGYHSLYRDWDGHHNVSIGNEAMDNVSHGAYNTAIGSNSLRVQRYANYGGAAIEGETVNYNTSVGGDSQYDTIGSCNTTIGYASLKGKDHGAVGNNNIAIGYYAGRYNENDDCTLIIDSIDRKNHENQRKKAIVWGHIDEDETKQTFKINAMFACNGATPQEPLTANNDASDLQSCISLLNQIKEALQKCGIMK